MSPKRAEILSQLASLQERLLLHTFMISALPAWVVALAWYLATWSAIADVISHTLLHVLVATAIILLICGVVCLFRRRHVTRNAWIRRTVLLFIPVAMLTLITEPWKLYPWIDAESSPTATKILVWNAYLMNDNYAEIEQLIRQHDPDIVAIIECNEELGKWLTPLREEYAAELWGAQWRSQSMVVLSKFDDSQLQFENIHGMKTAVVRFTPRGSAEEHLLYVIHTLSPDFYGERVHVRNKQLTEIAHAAEKNADRPLLVVGDFNTSPWSRVFQRMLTQGQLIDTRSYRGYFASWPSFFYKLGIPIDHALANSHVNVLHRCVLKEAPGSDHRPILLEIQ